MTWLLILVILAAAFAPVAYMMPSKRDKALASLRMIARREGLEVDVTHLPKIDAEPHERVSAGGVERQANLECVSYGLRLPKSDAKPVSYRLLYSPATTWPVLPGQAWEMDDRFRSASKEVPAAGAGYWSILSALEPLLPVDRLGLAVTDQFVLFYWRERLSQETQEPAQLVANIRQLLNKVADHHRVSFPSNLPPNSGQPAP